MCHVFSAMLTVMMMMMIALIVSARNCCNRMANDHDVWCNHVKPFPLRMHHAHAISNTEIFTEKLESTNLFQIARNESHLTCNAFVQMLVASSDKF